MFKQSLVLDKSNSTLVNNKYVFKLKTDFRIRKWRLKQCYFPQNSLQTQIDNITEAVDQYYFNSSYTGTETGSKHQPFKNLSSFTSVILASTPRKIKVILDGTFTTDTININHIDWDISLDGHNNCVIKSDVANVSKDIMKVTTCKRLVVSNLEFNTGKYGLRTYGGDEIIIDNVRCIKCGSTGVLANHTTETQSNLATLFSAGTVLSDGGGLRLKCNTGGSITVSNCYLEFCLRSIRIETASKGSVSNCYMRYCSDNGIYLRESHNISVTGNYIYNMGHNSLLSIYSSNSSFIGNHCINGWGAPICNYGSINITYQNNIIENCNTTAYTGYGSTGDNMGQVCFRSNLYSGLTGDYIAKIIDNVFTKTTTLNNVIVNFDSGIKPSYTTATADILYFNNKYDNGLTQTLDTWTITGLNQISLTSSDVGLGNVDNTSDANKPVSTAQQTEIDTKHDTLSVTQLTTINKTIDSVATGTSSSIATCDDIRAEIAAAGGGSGTFHVHYGHMTVSTQLLNDITYLVWGRTSSGNQSAMNGRFTLPLAPADGMQFDVYSHNIIDGTGGSIIFTIDGTTGQTFHSYVDYESDTWLGSSTIFAIQDVGRRHYKVLYLVNGTAKEWHIRRVSPDISATEIAQITTNQPFVIHFQNTESSYPSSSPYQLPSSKMFIDVVYGNGIDFSSVSNGVYIYLPINPPDGCMVSCENTMYKNTSTNTHTINIYWTPLTGVPTTRKLNWIDNGGVLHEDLPAVDYTIQVRAESGKRRRAFFRYSSVNDFWVHSLDSS